MRSPISIVLSLVPIVKEVGWNGLLDELVSQKAGTPIRPLLLLRTPPALLRAIAGEIEAIGGVFVA